MPTSQKLPESVFIFGCGYVGSALARSLVTAGVRVGALTRNAEKVAQLREFGLAEVIEADLDASTWHTRVAGGYEAAVNCVSSSGGGLAGYRKSYVEGQRSILKWAGSQQLQRYVYTSSTSVYPQDEGEAVDETAETHAAPPTGQVILESEALLAESADRLGRWFVLRLAGIYGPGRHYLLNQLREGAGDIPGSGDYALNMVHLDDIVSAIFASLTAEPSVGSGIFNIADDAPETKAEVLVWLAEQIGRPTPKFNPEKVSERLKRRGADAAPLCEQRKGSQAARLAAQVSELSGGVRKLDSDAS